MKAVQLNQIELSAEKYTDRIWELTHSKKYQKIGKTKLKELFKRESKEQFYKVNKFELEFSQSLIS